MQNIGIFRAQEKLKLTDSIIQRPLIIKPYKYKFRLAKKNTMNCNNSYSHKNPLFSSRDEIPRPHGSFNHENFNFDPNLPACYRPTNARTNQSSMRFDVGITDNPFPGFENPLPSLLPSNHPPNQQFLPSQPLFYQSYNQSHTNVASVMDTAPAQQLRESQSIQANGSQLLSFIQNYSTYQAHTDQNYHHNAPFGFPAQMTTQPTPEESPYLQNVSGGSNQVKIEMMGQRCSISNVNMEQNGAPRPPKKKKKSRHPDQRQASRRLKKQSLVSRPNLQNLNYAEPQPEDLQLHDFQLEQRKVAQRERPAQVEEIFEAQIQKKKRVDSVENSDQLKADRTSRIFSINRTIPADSKVHALIPPSIEEPVPVFNLKGQMPSLFKQPSKKLSKIQRKKNEEAEILRYSQRQEAEDFEMKSITPLYSSEMLKFKPFEEFKFKEWNKRKILEQLKRHQPQSLKLNFKDDEGYLKDLGKKEEKLALNVNPNPFDYTIRDHADLKFIDFNKLDSVHEGVSHNMRHFIRRKQNQLNIKRQCGVSYVVPTESHQLFVSDRYDKLAPIVYQATDCVQPLDSAEGLSVVDELFMELFVRGDQPILITAFESVSELEMKNYLLKPEERWRIAGQRFWLILSIKELWTFFKEKQFICIHLFMDKAQMIRNPEFKEFTRNEARRLIEMSDIQLGILIKASGRVSVKTLVNQYGEDYDREFDKGKVHSSLNELEEIDETNPTLSQQASLSKYDGMSQISESESVKRKSSQFERLEAITGCVWDKTWSVKDAKGLLTRIELYFPEQKWKELTTPESKSFLLSFIQKCQSEICQRLKDMNIVRTTYHSLTLQDIALNFQSGDGPVYIVTQKQQNDHQEGKKAKEDENYLYHFQPSKFNLLTDSKIEIMKKFKQAKDQKMIESIVDPIGGLELIRKRESPPVPICASQSRDSFVYDLKKVVTYLNCGEGRERVRKTQYYFEPENCPDRIDEFVKGNKKYFTGVTTYDQFFSPEELDKIEQLSVETEHIANRMLPMTAQTHNPLKRTKFFFGNRYIWSEEQLAEKLSYVAAGVRCDVSSPLPWMWKKIVNPLVNGEIIEKGFIDSIAMNAYQDGSEGLGQHFDDSTRFKQPIYTLRLFSDSRLSFGCQLYGFVNGAFFAPLARGCICVLEDGSFAANGVKHCIRPADMTGKSSAFILRQFQPGVVSEAKKYDLQIDLPMWLSSMSLNEHSIKYAEQKRMEAKLKMRPRCPLARQAKQEDSEN